MKEEKIIKKRFIFYLALVIQINERRSQNISYCLKQSSDGQNCLQCIDGYNLIQQSQDISSLANSQNSFQSISTSNNNNTICQAQCSPYFYRATSPSSDGSYACSSTCSQTQLGDNLTRSCQEVFQCPDSFQFGQSFHQGIADNLIFYRNNLQQGMGEILTSSPSDQRVLVWDSQTGQLTAEFQGHTSGVLRILFIDNKTNQNSDVIRLLSFSSGGEVIIWNFLKATIISKIQVINGQLSSSSEVELSSNSIISFGLQGEFYLVNFITSQSSKFVGHTQVVTKVVFIKSSSGLISSDYLISTSMDKNLLLWQINSPNSPLQLITQFQITSFFILPLSLTSQTTSLYLFAYGLDVLNNKIATKVCNLGDINDSNFKTNFINNMQTFNDHINSIINIIVDQNNIKMITYSYNELIFYDSKLIGANLTFLLNSQSNLATLFPSADIQIANCQLFGNRLIISSLFGEILLFQYSPSQQPIVSTLPQNYITIQREKKLNSVIKFQYSDVDNILFAYANQVVAINYSTRTIQFIINNFPNPTIAYTSAALKVYQKPSNSLVATVSTDGRGFVYDKITFQLISVLQYSKNLNLSRFAKVIQPVTVVIVLNQNVCISYQDTAFVCYDPVTAQVNYQHQNNVEAYLNLFEDYTRNFVFAFGLSQAVVYDLNLKKVRSQIFIQNQFYVYNIQCQFDLLYVSSPSGILVKLNYPDLSVQYQKDYTYLNQNSQKINGWKLDDKNNLCIVYFDGGLVILINTDLSLIKSLSYKSAPTICGINYPEVATCATIGGGVVAWGLYVDYFFEQQLLNFPIQQGQFSFIYGQAFLQIDYAAYGSGIMVGDLQYLLASQNFNTIQKIQNFNEDDDRMQIFTVTDQGSVNAYHFTPQPSIIVQWQQVAQNQVISKVQIFQEAYKYIILSQAVTVFDYLNQQIYKVKQLHKQMVNGVIIDKPRFTLITFNQDTSKNLFAWSYEQDKSYELVGHTAGINGAYLQDTLGTLITYSNDGFIIVWNYLQNSIVSKLNNHNSQAVLDLFIKPFDNSQPNGRILFISRGANYQICIYDFQQRQPISFIQLNAGTNTLVTDDLYQRVFVLFTNTIYVYSYLTGLKITQLPGFDGDIGQNFIIQGNYIIAGAQLVIQSFNRQTLNLLFSDKSTQNIYQMSLLGNLVGIISNGINDIVKVWNYQTGTMLQDMTNQYYPLSINGIMAEQEANIFFVMNVKNQIFTFNPFSSSFSKVQDFMILPIFTSDKIIEILIDKQSNTMIAYNNNAIMQWKFYSYLGQSGQQQSLPSNSLINLAYNPINDLIFYSDFERNVWLIQENSLQYLMQLSTQPLQSIIVGNVLIIREQTTIKSYNTNYQLVSTLSINSYLLISDKSESSYFFIVNMTQDIVKVSVDQTSSVITIKKTYQQKDGVTGDSTSRIVYSIINANLTHLIVCSQNGSILVVNYANDQKLATLTNHSNRVTKINIDISKGLMVSSSIDGSIGLYAYSQTLVSLLASVPIGGQIDQILLDAQYDRLLIWINLQTKILIFNTATMSISGTILAPSDTYIQMKLSQSFNKYAVFNFFQVNIYDRQTFQFISSIRNPSDLNDIVDVSFLGSNLILVNSKSSLRIYQIQTGSITAILTNQYNMQGSQIVSQSFDPATNIVNLKGINYKTSFNYTFMMYSQNQSNAAFDQSFCYSNIQNSKSYFTMKRSIDLHKASFTQFGLGNIIKTVKYNIIYSSSKATTDLISVFYPDSNSASSTYQDLFFYETKFNQQGIQPRILVGLSNALTEYTLSQLQLKKYALYIQNQDLNSNPQPVKFHPNTQTFIFNDGEILNQTSNSLITQGFLFTNVSKVIIEGFSMANIYFDGTYTSLNTRILSNSQQQGSSSLFYVSSASYVYIKQIVISNCTFKNQNLFKFENIQTIIIDNIQFKNITFESTLNNTNALFQMISSQNIQISNIQIINCSTLNKFNVFSMLGNIYTKISQITISQSINSRILYYIQTYTQAQYQYKVITDTLIMDTFNINNVNTTELSLIDLQTNNVQIASIKANNVTCQSCLGSVISADANQFILTDSTFKNNAAYQGGSIYLSNCQVQCLLNQTKIINNQAINGGGILLQNSELQLKDTQIINNTAQIGGGIRYTGIIPKQFINKQWQNNNNIIQGNTAQIFGDNLASHPRSMKLTFQNNKTQVYQIANQTSDSFSQSYLIQNVMSGDNFLFKIQLIDEENNPVKIKTDHIQLLPQIVYDELNSYQFQCISDNDLIQLNSETLIGLNKYEISTHSFVFDKLAINSKPPGTNYFYVKTNAIQLQSPQNSSLFFTPQFNEYIQIQFRSCQVGELFMPKQAGQLEYCKQCPDGMYSLADPYSNSSASLSCKICPTTAVNCYRDVIELKNGYWRETNNTDTIVECVNAPDNCQGESSESKFYCKQGYIGPLCETCDIESKIWPDRYSYAGNFSCKKCDSLNSYYLMQGLAFLLIILYVIYGVVQSNFVSKKKIIGYYMRMAGFASIGTSDCEDYTSIFLKFLMHYLYISKIVNKLNFQLPFVFDFIQVQISTPIDQMKFVPDCYRSIFNQQLKPVYSRQVISQIVPLFYLTSVSLIYFLLVQSKKIKHNSNQIFNGLVFLFIFIQPDLLSGIISATSCRTIGDKQYITDDISSICLSRDHVIFILSFSLPFFIIWAFLLPSLLFSGIYKLRKNLDFIKPRIRFGFLYQEYRLKIFYWEFLKIALKLLITIVNNFISDNEILKSSISTLFILKYVLLSIRLRPYQSHIFNKCDQYSHIILIVILHFNIIINITSQVFIQSIAIILFYFFHYSFIIYLILQILKSKIKALLVYFAKRFPYFEKQFSSLLNLMNAKVVNKMQVYKNWKKVYAFVYCSNFKKRREENNSMLELTHKQEKLKNQISKEKKKSIFHNEQNTPRTSDFQIDSSQVNKKEDDDQSQSNSISIEIQKNSQNKEFPKVHSIKSIQKDQILRSSMEFAYITNRDLILSSRELKSVVNSPINQDYNFQEKLVKTLKLKNNKI
ncbi:WD domain, G-beta repeat protein (macronuclear) [Tetrahymena thermophila SB210]|uniref:WD domain, G-beta repeat protein n=1 Tax=Tetrahymena thermophila (strain SB210) TaxID=312017 RepID=I7MAJ1_TETTS|nr:WD domain, G-beta repeat protein [Tetrahymena thermophila SB210]EAS04694.2 WD domain, G-beta repeat protein [Tetrahymena thermophila SB210]|eukprot:XP_001024939.2 WD domain, G-beta repeat protein [Tetrahymena thermophila SB210]